MEDEKINQQNGLFERFNPLLKQAHTVGKAAVEKWRDSFDSHYHTERIMRRDENQKIVEEMALRDIADHEGDNAGLVLHTESLCSLFGNALLRGHDQEDVERIAWSTENLQTFLTHLPEGTIDYLFKQEDAEIIKTYIEIPST